MNQPNITFYRPCGEAIRDMRAFCTHIIAGNRCASPALRGQNVCYHHQPSRINLPTRQQYYAQRRARRNFPVPRPTNQLEINDTVILIVRALLADTIASPRAGRLLAALQHMNGEFSRNLSWEDDPLPSHPQISYHKQTPPPLPVARP